MKSILLLATLLAVIGCGHIRQDGGQAPFDPEVYRQLGPEEQATYAETVIKREERDPDGITLKEMRESKHGEIRRVGLILFETQFQPSISGLAKGLNVYMNDKGKQILTEQALAFWLDALSMPDAEWVSRKELEKSPAFRGYGSIQNDFIIQKQLRMTDEEIFWRNSGKEIPMGVLMLPRNQQDVTVLFIPATEMMIGSKPVEHQKHWVNDISKELGLDAVLIVSSSASWQAGGEDKRTHEKIPEEMKVSVSAALMYPFNRYHRIALKEKKLKNLPQKSIPVGSYSVETKLPIKLTVPESEQTFATIEKNILDPFWSTYQAVAGLMVERIKTDIRQSHHKGTP